MRAPVVISALTGLLLCAGCGSSSKVSDPVAAAAQKTAAHGGAYTVAIDFSKAEKNGGKYNGGGAFDGNGNFTLDVTYKGMPIHAIAAVNPASHLIVYLQSAAFTGQLPPDKTWVSADVTQLVARHAGTKALDAVESPGTDPTQMLALLARDSSGSHKLGRGRYRVRLDLAKAAKEPGVTGAEAKQLQRTAKATSIAVDVTLDGDGYIRAIDEHVLANGTVALRFPRLTPPKRIEAPPANDVFDVTDQLPAS